MPDIKELAEDKQFLRQLADNNYTLGNDIDTFDFAIALLANLASPDEELRDALSYMLLAQGIIDRGKLSPEQLSTLLTTVLDDEHLFFRIGEARTDTVFMRSFSDHLIAAILYSDANNPTLPAKIVKQTRQALFRYAEHEQDWRGYIPGKGWAYTMAHLADSLDECAQHPATSEQEREEIMQLVSSLAKLRVPLYHEEDIRLATVSYHIILGKQISSEFLAQWLENCFVERDSDIRSWISATNMKNFLRSLYFFLSWDNIAISVGSDISNLLKRQDAIYMEKDSIQ